MSVLYRTLIHLLPILALPVAVMHGQAQQPSAWWYPLGNPEATRNNPVPTTSQKAEDLRIKWRTDQLKNSPVLLVGGIRTEEGRIDQQVVGMEAGSNEVMILKSSGLVGTNLTFENYLVGQYTLRLTGLFNSEAPTVNPVGRPNVIGIGVEAIVDTNPSTPPAGGLLVSAEGTLVLRLGLRDPSENRRVASNVLQGNRRVGIFPVAAYKPVGETYSRTIGVVSQPNYEPYYVDNRRVDTVMINSMRLYSFETPDGSLKFAKPFTINGIFAVAPKAYPQPPALMYDTANKSSYITLSGSAYSSDSSIQIASQAGFTGVTTSSRRGWISIASIESQSITPITTDSTRFIGGAAHAFLFENFFNDTAEKSREPILIIAEQGSTTARPRILFSRFTPALNQDPFTSESLESFHSGWDIVAADLDGSAPGSDSDVILANNLGYEFLATWRPNGLSPNGTNWLYMFRQNLQHLIGTRAFSYVTRQQISGSVTAAGDLVADEHGRQEAIVVDGNKLSVLQLKPYTDPNLRTFTEDVRRPFATLATFTLGSPIVSVAIADLEGDGENDIIVCTTDSTYAIGMVQPDPYPFATQPENEFCLNDTIQVAWDRSVGGESEAVQAKVVGTAVTGDDVEAGPLRLTLGDSLEIVPSGVPLLPGTYRFVISNTSYPYVADSSEPFDVVEGSVRGFDLRNDTSYDPGAVIADTIVLNCVDEVRIERSIGDTLSWEDAPGTLTALNPDGDSLNFSDELLCSSIYQCGADDEQKVFYRIVAAGNPLTAQEVRVRIPQFQFISIDSGLAHRRSLTWAGNSFPCDELSISISADGGATWIGIDGGNVPASDRQFDCVVPDEISDSVLICIHCTDPDICGYGVRPFAVARVDMGNYVYPNPFDPDAPSAGSGGAEIVYSLRNSASVSITVYDASRSVVRELVKSEDRREGRNRGDFWDGKNYKGEYVANGTYICVVSSSNGEQIILPIFVVKRR